MCTHTHTHTQSWTVLTRGRFPDPTPSDYRHSTCSASAPESLECGDRTLSRMSTSLRPHQRSRHKSSTSSVRRLHAAHDALQATAKAMTTGRGFDSWPPSSDPGKVVHVHTYPAPLELRPYRSLINLRNTKSRMDVRARMTLPHVGQTDYTGM